MSTPANYLGLEVVPVEQTETFNPTSGYTTVWRYRGTKEALKAFKDQKELEQYATVLREEEGQYELTVSIPQSASGGSGGPNQSVPGVFDEWNMATAYSETDIWADPAINQFISAQVINNSAYPANRNPPATTSPTLTAQWVANFKHNARKYLESMYDEVGKPVRVEDKALPGPTLPQNANPSTLIATQSLDPAQPEYKFFKDIYPQLAAGLEKSRTVRTVLQLKREIPTTHSMRFTPYAADLAWSAVGLRNWFFMPDHIYRLLPDYNPPGADPYYLFRPNGKPIPVLKTTWLWKVTRHDVQLTSGSNKAVESLEWTLAAWSDFNTEKMSDTRPPTWPPNPPGP